ncbi:uncharacterized protein LOC113391871 isoform X2 [Vanessa tameamea]|uniref:Uncharacterized protein LOC113391871 isoform X2 n=1 Tax=Vanessa tameamea TaxID=334116 RepID=A0ABM4AWA5_VANTA
MADMNVDNFENIQDLLGNGDPGHVPSTKELLEMLETAEIDDEMKASLKSMLAGDVPQFFGGHGSGTVLAVVFASLIFLIILFFGYKLYKSIKDKEKKREEKKKLKQMKKKK